jgi:hypothetical protein
LSTGGGNFPRWSRNGHELFFTTLFGQVMVVEYTVKGDSLAIGTPKVWTETRIRLNGTFPNYDVAPNGKRLAAMVADDALNGEAPHPEVVFLLHFFDELLRKVPTGK